MESVSGKCHAEMQRKENLPFHKSTARQAILKEAIINIEKELNKKKAP